MKTTADNATLIGTVAGVRFYEDPEYGDEAPLLAERPFRKDLETTDWYELPDYLEVLD